MLRDRGLLNFDEPFQRLLTQGMVQGNLQNPASGKYFAVDAINPNDPKDPQTGEPLRSFHEKMSKSKYNGVDRIGSGKIRGRHRPHVHPVQSAARKDLEWDDADVEGQFRFNRVWRLVMEFVNSKGQSAAEEL